MARWRTMVAAGLLTLAAQADPHLPPPVIDRTPPAVPATIRGGVLIVSKTSGWRHIEHLPTSNAVLAGLARDAGRRPFATENAAVFDDALLARFAVVVLNSTSGDFATPPQRAALRRWIERGGGVVAIHAAGDGSQAWDWWIDDVIGTRFTGHPNGVDQFQAARVDVAQPRHPVMAGVRLPWRPVDEWYAFDRVPAGRGVTLLATIDEASYRPDPAKAMAVHPVIWARAVGRGRVVYIALGHAPEAYRDPNLARIVANALRWVSSG